MVGKPEESSRKIKYSLTLNPDVVEEARRELRIDSLSAWVNNSLRDCVLNQRIIFECSCGCAAGVRQWNDWLLMCPTCKADHAKLDRRKRIKLEG